MSRELPRFPALARLNNLKMGIRNTLNLVRLVGFEPTKLTFSTLDVCLFRHKRMIRFLMVCYEYNLRSFLGKPVGVITMYCSTYE